MGICIRLQILETACEVAWQLLFPGAVFESSLSATCAVFKEMAEWFCFGLWQGMGTDEETLVLASNCAKEKEQKESPAWLVVLGTDLVHELMCTEVPSWYRDGRWLGKYGLLWGWLFSCTELLCIGKS